MSGSHLRRFAALSFAAALAVATSSCGSKKATLYIYNWCDYLSPEVKAAFEEKYNCRIVEDIFDSNEMLEAKLKAGASDYDIVVPSTYAACKMYEQGMLQKLDASRIPNLKNLDPEVVAKLPEGALDYCVPYTMSHTGIAYLKSKIPDFEASWAMFEREDLTKRFSLLNDSRETIGAALRYLGYAANSSDPAELEAAAKKALEWKANAAKFDNEQYKQGIASGEFYFVHGYVGDLLQVQEDNDDIEITFPKEGTLLSIDTLAIPAGARNVDLAYAFIDFVNLPENAALNTEEILYLCPNTPSYELLSEDIRNNKAIFLDPETFARCELICDLGESQALYNHVWETIKGKDALDEEE